MKQVVVLAASLILFLGCSSMEEKGSVFGTWRSELQDTEWGSLVYEISLLNMRDVECRMIFFPNDPSEIIWKYVGTYSIEEDRRFVFDFSSEGIDFSNEDTLTGEFDQMGSEMIVDVGKDAVTLRRVR